MATLKAPRREGQLRDLLRRDHTLNGGVLFGIDGYVIEIQARAVQVLRKPRPWGTATGITGMAGIAVREALSRIVGAFAKYEIPRASAPNSAGALEL